MNFSDLELFLQEVYFLTFFREKSPTLVVGLLPRLIITRLRLTGGQGDEEITENFPKNE